MEIFRRGPANRGVECRGYKQEAQLSQRDRAMLRVIGYFDKSLKVIRNDTLEKGVKSKLVFCCIYVCISYNF